MECIQVDRTASDGTATGEAYIYQGVSLPFCMELIPEAAAGREIDKFLRAREAVCQRLQKLSQTSTVFEAHLMMAADATLEEAVAHRVKEERMNAGMALTEAVGELRNIFLGMEDEYMRERSADIKDVGRQLLAEIQGIDIHSSLDIKEPAILVARELMPSDTARLNKDYVLGLLTEEGGVTSHVSIMAKGWGIPALLGVKGLLQKAKNKDIICMDAGKGEIIISPTEEMKQKFDQKKDRHKFDTGNI
ncbi:phosphoenolpyruvate-utilizing N-terminal domain-containing protein [Luxibacter massiliensis]|uniref:phosphoenolpyruvate-utilizing N-terminal domain-containing protein n=1 Tax=Luxibacter massiliensis TaxID=2219695 RepID=UPI000F046630|nr:phosphoenolpyruvate-utilizing N-terminal domain-containing protein [Luxibacter massiliensis]